MINPGRASLQEVQNQQLQKSLQEQKQAYADAYGTNQPVVSQHQQALGAVNLGAQDPQAYNRMLAELAVAPKGGNTQSVAMGGGGGGGGGGWSGGPQTSFASSSSMNPIGGPMSAPSPINIGGPNKSAKMKFSNPF